MPAWTLRFLMSECTAMAGEAAYHLEPSRVSLLVNQALQEVALTTPLAEKETIAVSSLSSGEPKFYLPADCDEIVTFSYLTAATGAGNNSWWDMAPPGVTWPQWMLAGNGGWIIRQASPWEVDSQSEGTQTGVPDRYLWFGSWLEVYPSPNSAYSVQLRYFKTISDLTNLDAVPSIATRFHGAVRLKAAELLCERTGDTAHAAYFANRYVGYMNTMPDIQKQRLRDRTGAGLRVQFIED